MGNFKDVIDVLRDPDTKKLLHLDKKRYSSISKQASEGILQFPVIVSDTIDPETLQMVAKALERNFASFITVCISMNPTLTSSEDVTKYLSQFHRNTSMKTNKFDFLNNVGAYIESYEHVIDDAGNVISTNVYMNTEGTAKIMEMLTFDNNGGFLQGLNEGILNNIVVLEGKSGKDRYKDYRSGKGKGKHEKSLASRYSDIGMMQDAIDQYEKRIKSSKSSKVNGSNGTFTSTGEDIDNKTKKESKKEKQRSKDYWNSRTLTKNITIDEHKGGHTDKNIDIHKGGFNDTLTHKGTIVNKETKAMDKSYIEGQKEIDKYKHMLDKDKEAHKHTFDDLNAKMLTDNDARKANELVPTMLHIRLRCINNEGSYAGNIDFMLGIKAHMHLVKHQEMMTHLMYGLTNRGKFFNFLRWTSGEITFFKDFLFNIKETKRDVANRSAGADDFWLTAKRYKKLSQMNDRLPGTNRLLPNSTIVVSRDEVDYIKTNYGHDLLNSAVANKLIDEYYLLGFVVVDASTQIIHFLFEGRRDYEAITFSGLERENSDDSRKFKEMLKAINRN